MDVIDDKTVQITLNRADGAFLDNLAMFVASIVPKAVVEAIGDEEFVLEPGLLRPLHAQELGSAVSASSSSATRDYWRAPMPYLDGVTLRLRPGRQHAPPAGRERRGRPRRGRALRAGRAHRRPRRRLGRVRGRLQVGRDLAEHERPAARRAQRPPGAQLRHARRRTSSRASSSVEATSPTTSSPTSSTGTRAVPGYPYDIDKAKELMAASSVPDGFDLKMLIPAGDSTRAGDGAGHPGRVGRDRRRTVQLEPVDLGTAFGRWLGEDPNAAMAATFPGSALSTRHAVGRQPLFVFIVPDTGLRSFGTNYGNPEVVDIRDGNASLDEDGAGIAASPRRRPWRWRMRRPCRCSSRTPARAVGGRREGLPDLPIGWWTALGGVARAS